MSATDWDRISGYTIPPQRIGRRHITDAQVRAALHTVNRELGRRRNHPVSIEEYQRVRRHHPDMPSVVGLQRRYGSWSAALHTVGVRSNAPRHDYRGALTDEETLLWLAHWLRTLRHQPEQSVASAAAYRVWAAGNPGAPRVEALRLRGNFGDLVRAAAAIERTTDPLPVPRPVTYGSH